MKVSDVGETVPSVVSVVSVVSVLLRPMVTSALGWALRTTVKVSVPPAPEVTSPEVGDTVKPAPGMYSICSNAAL